MSAQPTPTAPPRPELAGGDPPRAVLRRLLAGGVVPADGWDALSPADREQVAAAVGLPALADALLAHRLFTPFQAGRVRAGDLAGLVLGNYRLLDRLGAGGVYRAEHVRLKQPAAVRVLAAGGRRGLDRFFLEQRALANLRHPNIVAAVDAGEEPHAGPDGRPVPYLVTEHVPGRTLAELVAEAGPLPAAVACELLHQTADALTEAHRHGLVHRGLKPSSVVVTPGGRAKLLDFGLARLAPDPPDADARTDVLGMAATLFFALTGQAPSPAADLLALRPDLPPGLAAALARMSAPDPDARTPTADAALRELAPFRGGGVSPGPATVAALPPDRAGHRVLIVDDEEPVRRVCRLALRHEPLACDEVSDGAAAVARAAAGYDLVLLDVDLPGLDGERVLRHLRAAPPTPHLKVVMLSGRATGDDLAHLLAAGADDYLTKPFSVAQLRGRVAAALRLKDAQDRADRLARQLAAANAQLEVAVSAKADELVHARGAMVLAMAKLVERKSVEGGGHLLRLQRYCRVLGEAAAATPGFAGRLDAAAVAAVEATAPLHDIGKVAVPDAVLNKPGPLTPAERRQMQQHTTAGADTLAEVAARYPLFGGFFATAVDVARSHHERWDGTGYPHGLAGEAIPLAARLVAVTDVYDALRSRRVYKPSLSHPAAVELMLHRSPGHFDPALLAVFERVAGRFDRVFRETED